MAGINIIFKRISVSANAIKSGVAGWWRGVARVVNSATGRLVDFSVNENEGTLNTSPYLSFDGTNDRITIADSISGIKCAAVWVNPTTTTEPLFDFDGGATTIYISSGTVLTKGITSPTVYVNDAQTTTASSGAWQLVVVSSNTAWSSSSFTFGEEGGGYFTGGACYIRLFADALNLEDVKELYYYPERAFPARTQYSRMLLFLPCMETSDVSSYIASYTYNPIIARYQGPTFAEGGPEPVPQFALMNSQKRVYSATDTYVDITHDPVLNVDTSGDWSLVAKFWLRTTSGAQGFIVKDALNSAYALSLQSGNIDFRGAGASGALTYSASQYEVYTVVATVESGTTAILYINGTEEDTGTITAAGSTSGDLQLMGYGSSNEMSGFMYYAAVYDKTLSEYQAQELANGKLPFEVDGGYLKGCWINDGVDTWIDRTNNGNDGTVTGTAPYIYDIEGRAGRSALNLPYLSHRGNNLQIRGGGYVSVSDDSTIDAQTGITLEAWVKVQTIGATQQIILKGSAYGLKIQPDNTIRFSFWQTSEKTLDSTTTVSADTWYHIAATYDGSDAYLYLNGELESEDDSFSGNIDTNSNDLLIGASATTPSDVIDGDIGQVRVYTSAATALEVARNYRKQEKLY